MFGSGNKGTRPQALLQQAQPCKLGAVGKTWRRIVKCRYRLAVKHKALFRLLLGSLNAWQTCRERFANHSDVAVGDPLGGRPLRLPRQALAPREFAIDMGGVRRDSSDRQSNHITSPYAGSHANAVSHSGAASSVDGCVKPYDQAIRRPARTPLNRRGARERKNPQRADHPRLRFVMRGLGRLDP